MSVVPKISVVIPCRNMGAFVGAAIESILSQTHPVHEIIVVDDSSEDNTWHVITSFGERVKALKGPGKGSSIARNRAILAATGDHIAFLDADDLWLPHKLERQIPLLSPDCGFVFGDWYRSECPERPGEPLLKDYSMVTEGWVFSNLLRQNFISTPTVLLRKDILARTGLFKPRLIGSQDIDLWLRLSKQTQFGWVREPLVFMRKHGGNITSSAQYPYYQARLWAELLREHQDEGFTDLAYMHHRRGQTLYDAGRHAVRQMDQPMARHHFSRALLVGHRPALVGFWYLVSLLPHGVLSYLLQTKRDVARKLAAGS